MDSGVGAAGPGMGSSSVQRTPELELQMERPASQEGAAREVSVGLEMSGEPDPDTGQNT